MLLAGAAKAQGIEKVFVKYDFEGFHAAGQRAGTGP